MAATRTDPASRTRGLPAGVYVLGFGLFAMGSAEFLLAGVLPTVATDLHVSLSAAGFLITAFALGVVLGGPPFAVLSLRWPRRTALAATQAVFAASMAAGLLGDYRVMLASRVVQGVAYAGYFAIASVTAIGLVTPDRTARASGVVVSGLSVAMVAGGPAGTLLGHLTTWRTGFWAVVALTTLGILTTLTAIPSSPKPPLRPEPPRREPGHVPGDVPGDGPGRGPRVAREVAALGRPVLWGMFGVTILTTAGYMITFNYLAAMLTEITGVPGVWVPGVLAIFGVGAFAGLSVGGRISDRRPHLALLGGAAAIVLLSLVLAAAVRVVWVVVPVVLLLGVAAFVLNPAIYGRVFAIAADAPTLAGATTVSAFQLGISITPALAALAFAHGGALTSVCAIGAALATASLPLILTDRSHRHRQARSHPRDRTHPNPSPPPLAHDTPHAKPTDRRSAEH